VLVSEVLEIVKPCYGGSWEEVRELFKKDDHEWARIEALIEEFQKYGQLKPGTLFLDDETNELILSNGTHRFVAAWESGLLDFKIIDEESSDKESYFWKSTKVKLAVENLTSDEFDKLFDCLSSRMSFRLDDLWLESGLQSSQGFKDFIEIEIIFEEDIPENKFEALGKIILERISCCFHKDWLIDLEVANVHNFQKEFFA
jgi:RNAse (barnase) inhibitor barstar